MTGFSERRCSSLAWRSEWATMRLSGHHSFQQIFTAVTKRLIHMHWIQVVDILNLLFSHFLASNFITPGNNALPMLCFPSDFLEFFKTTNRISIKLCHTDNYLGQQEDWFFRLSTQPSVTWSPVVTTTLLTSRPYPDKEKAPPEEAVRVHLLRGLKLYGFQPKIQAGICSSGHKLFLLIQSKLPTDPLERYCPPCSREGNGSKRHRTHTGCSFTEKGILSQSVKRHHFKPPFLKGKKIIKIYHVANHILWKLTCAMLYFLKNTLHS